MRVKDELAFPKEVLSMTNYTGYQDPKRQESLVNPPEQNRVTKPSRLSQLKNIWQYLITVLAPGKEPRIWQKDRFGQTWWYAYDPVTERSVCRDSEDGIRIWLEERYYQSNQGSNPIRYEVKETATALFF